MANPNVNLSDLNNKPDLNFLNLLNSENSKDSHDFVNTDNLDSPYSSNKFLCSYLDEMDFAAKYCNSNKLSIMSLNIQSLPAKFQDLVDFVNFCEIKNCKPDVICLQEIWNLQNDSVFNLKGYQPPYFKTRKKHRGVGLEYMLLMVYPSKF